MENTIIIGSGPAGLTAALYAARANMEPLLITGNELGGQIATTTDVENFPGFAKGVNGFDLAQSVLEQLTLAAQRGDQRRDDALRFEHPCSSPSCSATYTMSMYPCMCHVYE